MAKEQKRQPQINLINNESCLQMKEDAKQNYQEFIRNRSVVSRFEPLRKENLIKKQLSNEQSHTDF